MPFDYDVAVVGLGRVGLPFAVYCSSKGLSVVGIDKDHSIIDLASIGCLPFYEPNIQELLVEGLSQRELSFQSSFSVISRCRNIILTVGTPMLSPVEPHILQVMEAINAMVPYLIEGQQLILRSTVPPGTTDYVAKYIEKYTTLQVGNNLFLSYCPERISEGHFLSEIETLPQIIGAPDSECAAQASEFLSILSARLLVTTPVQAELAKIWTNIFRYTLFALPNLLLMNCEQYQANVFEVIDLMNREYPRCDMPQPGLVGGTCLSKDFSFIEEKFNSSGMLTAVWRIQETMPLFLVETAKKHIGSLSNCKVAVLGLTFKSDSDDTRGSLSEKIVRYLQRELATIHIHDPFVQGLSEPLEQVLTGARLIIIATNHSAYSSPEFLEQLRKYADPTAFLVDIWNVAKSNKVFSFLNNTKI